MIVRPVSGQALVSGSVWDVVCAHDSCLLLACTVANGISYMPIATVAKGTRRAGGGQGMNTRVLCR